MQEEATRLAKVREANPKKVRVPKLLNDSSNSTLQVINLFE
jgi:hypothetical protein